MTPAFQVDLVTYYTEENGYLSCWNSGLSAFKLLLDIVILET